METTVIAVDGFASTGKSTLSKRLANALNFTYIDTGFMYRVVSYFALNSNLIEDDVILKRSSKKHLLRLNLPGVRIRNQRKCCLTVNLLEMKYEP